MPRIAYLTRRGNIWWFRRRHPVISSQTSQNHPRSGVCGNNRKRAQATGHTALSLQTTSKREARQLSAQVSADFERAWGLIEAHMTEENAEQELLDNLAMLITQSCRNNIGVLRSSPAATQDPRVKEKAYQILEQELRSALGVTVADTAPVASSNSTGTAPVSQADDPYDGSQTTDADDLAAIEAEMGEYEQNTLLSHIGPSARTNDDYYAEHLIREFSIHTMAFRTTFSEYLDACEKLGVDPRKATPDFEVAIKETLQAAKDLGLAQREVAAYGGTSAKNLELAKRKFSAFAEQYLEKRCAGYELKREDETPSAAVGGGFARNSLKNWQSSVRIFTEIIGDLSLSDYSKDDILTFNDFIQRLPKNYGKSSRDTRNAKEFIEQTDLEEEETLPRLIEELASQGLPEAEIEDKLSSVRVKRLSATTMKRHQMALKAIFQHAAELGAIGVNPFKGRTLTGSELSNRKKAENRITRVGWGDHIYALFGSEKFQKPLTDVGDPLFWGPIIATFSGMRMGEILQLRIADFATEDGVHYIAVQNSIGTQVVKSDSGFRNIPMHKALLDLGLLKLVELRRSQGMNRLFPNAVRSKSKGTLSAIMSKNFAYYIKSREIKEPGLDFHALRTDFHTRLTRKGVPDHVRKQLMGHENTAVTYKNYYPEGDPMEDLKKYVDRIDIDYSGISHPFGKPKAVKPMRLRVVGDD